MSCAEELKALATTLEKNSPSFKGWDPDVLQAFIRDGGICVYCGNPALPPGKGQGDHLLPKRYNVAHRVAACVCCNLDKGHYDPSHGEGAGLDLTDDEVREKLIREAKNEIDRGRREEERKFVQTSKVPFERAVAQYRKCKAREYCEREQITITDEQLAELLMTQNPQDLTPE